MQQDIEEFEAAGIQLIGISYDKVGILKKFAEKSKITFPLLSDEGSEVIKMLGIENKNGLPHSGTILVDQEKKVRGKLFLDGYVKRHSTDDLMIAAKAAGVGK